MKPKLLLPPALALAIAGGILGAQRQTISRLELESDVFSNFIASAENRPPLVENPPTPSRPQKTAESAIDWEEMAEAFGEMSRTGGMKDMRTMMSLQSRLQKMSKEELVAALDEIAALDIDETQRTMLQTMLIGPLIQKDPEFALTRFSKNLGDEEMGMGWQLSSALGEWAKKDPAAATAWFDREIAAGTFDSKSLDGKNRMRTMFESSLVAMLISKDPAAAEARVAALPADQRKEALNGFGFGMRQMKETDHAAFAALVRSQVTQKERIEIFGESASNAAMHGSLEDASKFLDNIAATPDERVKAAEKAALGRLQGKGFQSKVGTEDVDEMRTWLSTEAPGSVDRVTGESIGNLASFGGHSMGGMKFQEAADLALKYHESSGDDDVLTGFLDKAQTFQHTDEARELAGKISDPKKREEALEKLD